MKVFSPTQTARAMQCPMKNALYKEGWRPKHIGIPTLAATVGKAIALGLGVYNNYRMQLEQKGRQIDSITPDERETVSKYAMDVGLRHASDILEDIEKGEYIWHTNTDSYFRTVQERIGQTLVKYIASDPIAPEHRIVAVEHDLGSEYGSARIDLVFKEGDENRILDYKTASTYRAQYHELDMEKYRDLFQTYHYAWSWQDKYKEQIDQYYICHLITQGYKCDLRPYPISQESLSLWYQATSQFWPVMESIENGTMNPWMAAVHEDKWGQCEFKDACFRYKFEEQAMKAKYVKVIKEIE